MSDEQQEFPGTRPTQTRITGARFTELLLLGGEQQALQVIRKELAGLHKQHPSAVGIPLALSVIDRDLASVQMKTQRIVLAAAAKAGLDFDGRALMSTIRDDFILIDVTDDEAAA